ncbi:MAG: hypothetical protein AAF555_06125 [Verrucomicrobiota bacterium]
MKWTIILFLLLPTATFALQPEISASAEVASHYVLEGRDLLEGDGLVSVTGSASLGKAALELWLGQSPSQHYQELNAILSSTFDWGPLALTPSFNHLRFAPGESFDNELGLGTTLLLPHALELSVDVYYGVQSEGYFMVGSLLRPWPVHDCLTLIPQIELGGNQGFVSDGHDGLNHLSCSLTAEIALNEHCFVYASIAHTWGIDSQPLHHPGDASLRDFAYASIGITFEV